MTGETELPQWQNDEIERRAEGYRQNPEAASTWEEVKDRILRRNEIRSLHSPD